MMARMHTPVSLSTPASTASPGRLAAPRIDWKQELAEAIRDPAELCRLLDLDPALAQAAAGGHRLFPFLVPRGFAARMRRGDPGDPLLLQVLPRAEELVDMPGFTTDPLDEQDARRAGGLLQKYASRALLLLTGACAVNCRYCFRREFPYAESGATPAGTTAAVAAVAADPTLTEVILSGGDPLLLDDPRLDHLLDQLESIPHLRRLRIHSRLPVVLPSRITPRLLTRLAGSRLTVSLVIHANHAAELDETVATGLTDLTTAIPLRFNQAVLLKGINDSVHALAMLSERLISLGVVPYYLHLLDPVRGTAGFAVPDSRGQELIESLRRRLPGYAVPRLARELPGEPAKVWLA